MGLYPVKAQMFILKEMENLNIVILLVNLVFDIVIFMFILISVVLIYSLLMSGVETKTMESGIMRITGLSKRGLILMVITQAIMFVAPSVILAFVLCFPCLAVSYAFIFDTSLSDGF